MVSTSPLQLVVTRVLGPVRRLTAADAAFRPQLRRADVVQHVPQKPDTVNVPRTLLGNRLPHRRRLEVRSTVWWRCRLRAKTSPITDCSN